MKTQSRWATLIKLTFISFVFCFCVGQILASFAIPKLNLAHPIAFLSNDLKQDVELVIHQYIKTAKELTYSLYSLNDPLIQRRLKEKKAAGRIHQKKTGLMHQKILCLDSSVIVGTMNMTPSSIQRDKNMLVGIYSPFLTHKIRKAIQSNSFPAKLYSNFKEQQVEISFLPQDRNSLNTIIERIGNASKSIFIAMYYLSHPLICEALITAFNKGVAVHLFLNTKTKQALHLAHLGLDVRFHQKANLMHLKWVVIDETFFLIGSTNWTKNAFSQNDECHLWLYPLTAKQVKQLHTIWKKITH